MKLSFRSIEPDDNKPLALIVRNALAEFGANKPGTVYFDPTTDALFELFQTPRSSYFVALMDDKIVGGGGIFPTEGLPDDTCELVKMYLKPEARGSGIGKKLITMCEEKARQLGYKNIYLETLPELARAVKIYEKSGYIYLNAPMGNSGHSGCSRWMIKKF